MRGLYTGYVVIKELLGFMSGVLTMAHMCRRGPTDYQSRGPIFQNEAIVPDASISPNMILVFVSVSRSLYTDIHTIYYV